MKCSRTRSLLELALHDDVTESTRTRLERHLDHCSSCSEYAAGIEHLPLPVLRDEQPLSSSDLAAIRQSVMTSIHAEKEPRFGLWAFRFTAAVVAILLLSVAFFTLSSGVNNDGEMSVARQADTAKEKETAKMVMGDATPDVEVSEREETSTGIVVTQEPEIEMAPPAATASGQTDVEAPGAPERPLGSEEPAPQLAGNEKAEPSIRIELRTKDPTVRIIWLVSNQPEPPAEETNTFNHSISTQETS